MRSALFEYGVIGMPEQHLSPDQHIQLAEFFGDIDKSFLHLFQSSYDCGTQKRDQAEVIGGTWHTDHSTILRQQMCSILSAKELLIGGDTHFASMAAAYNAISQDFKTC